MSREVDDRELEDLLAVRADRARGDDEELLRAVANDVARVRQDRPGWVTPRLLRGDQRLGWIASVAAALAVGIAIGLVGPELAQPGSTASAVPSSPGASAPTPAPTPTTAAEASTPPPSATPEPTPIPVDVLTADEVASELAADDLDLGVIIVAGRMVADPLCGPPEQGGCRYRLLAGVPDLALLGHGYLQEEFKAPERSRVALEVTERRDEIGRRIAVVLAEEVITVGSPNRAFSVAELLGIRGPLGGWSPDTAFLVEGWLGGDDDEDCSPDRPPSFGYGCGAATWLSDDPDATIGPAIRLQNDAYTRFAFNPVGAGTVAEPRRGIYLIIRTVVAPCGPLADCMVDDAVHSQWMLRGRVVPSASTALEPICQEIDRTDCERVAAVAAGLVPEAMSITVSPYVPACIRAGSCMPGFGDYPHDFLLEVVDAQDRVSAFGCSDGAVPACEPVSLADARPLVTLRLDAAPEVRAVYVSDLGGTTWGASPDRDRSMPAGTYRIAAVLHDPGNRMPPPDFPVVGDPAPPDWCVATVTAEPGVVYELAISVHGSACTIDVVETGSRRD